MHKDKKIIIEIIKNYFPIKMLEILNDYVACQNYFLGFEMIKTKKLIFLIRKKNKTTTTTSTTKKQLAIYS